MKSAAIVLLSKTICPNISAFQQHLPKLYGIFLLKITSKKVHSVSIMKLWYRLKKPTRTSINLTVSNCLNPSTMSDHQLCCFLLIPIMAVAPYVIITHIDNMNLLAHGEAIKYEHDNC